MTVTEAVPSTGAVRTRRPEERVEREYIDVIVPWDLLRAMPFFSIEMTSLRPSVSSELPHYATGLRGTGRPAGQ